VRKGIDYIGVGTGAIIVNTEGKLFLAKRGRESRNERYKWEFPGGSVEFGEHLQDALIREIREEYGVVIQIDQLLDVVDHIIPQEHQHWISPTFLCRVANGIPHIMEPHKCDAIGWFGLHEIPVNELTIASRKSLESYQKSLLRKE